MNPLVLTRIVLLVAVMLGLSGSYFAVVQWWKTSARLSVAITTVQELQLANKRSDEQVKSLQSQITTLRNDLELKKARLAALEAKSENLDYLNGSVPADIGELFNHTAPAKRGPASTKRQSP